MNIVVITILALSIYYVGCVAASEKRKKMIKRVKKFCQNNPRMCKYFIKLMAFRNEEEKFEKRNKILNKYNILNELDAFQHIDKDKDDNRPNCHFSEKAEKLVLKIAALTKGREKTSNLITRIKSVIGDMILLPKSNIVCQGTRQKQSKKYKNRSKSKIQKKTKRSKVVHTKKNKDSLDNILSIFTDALNVKKEDDKRQKIAARVKENSMVDEFETNLANIFTFGTNKVHQKPQQKRHEESKVIGQLVNAFRIISDK